MPEYCLVLMSLSLKILIINSTLINYYSQLYNFPCVFEILLSVFMTLIIIQVKIF